MCIRTDEAERQKQNIIYPITNIIKQMKYFIASKWRNKEQVNELVARLREKDHEVFSFIESEVNFLDGKTPEEEMQAFESIKDWQNDSRIKVVYKSDIDGLREAEIFILLLPSGSSAHIEAGIAYGWNKKMVCIGQIDKPEIHYLIFDKFFDSIDQFISSISN